MSGLPDIGALNAQVGYSRLGWARLEAWPQTRCRHTARDTHGARGHASRQALRAFQHEG